MANSYNNVIKNQGTTDPFKMNANGSVSFPFAARGIVKDNVDTVKTGKIRVYIDDFGALDPNDASGWISVSYMSPFYGLTGNNSQEATTGYGKFVNNPHSYGFWATSPDVGSEVICVFLYGKKDFGFYIGCVPQPGLTHMVPAVASSDNLVPTDAEASSYGGAKRLPVTELNQNNSKLFDVPKFNSEPRPVHSYVAAQLFKQGLIRDNIRGTISSSASRESPSRVFGMSTPGRPIYRGISATTDQEQTDAVSTATNQQAQIISRRGGHSFVMDDGDKNGENNLVRLRSAAGHQITMSDDGETLFVTHANGQSYVELGKEGTVDIYATNSFNVRTKGDLNFHADNNININAKKSLNIYAEQININSDKDTTLRTGGNFIQQTLGNFKLKVNQGMSLASDGISSFLSKTTTYVNGSVINLNTGSSSLIPEDVKPLPIIMQTDSLFDDTAGWLAAPATLPTITSRTPAHAPWVNASLGADVQINETASANLPTAPSSAVAQVNNAVGPVTNNPVETKVAASVPITGEVSKTIDKNTSATMVAAVATNVANNSITATAAAAGGGIITDLDGTKAAVLGAIAHTPAQLEAGGYLKPGSAALVESLVAKGSSLEKAFPGNLWTGKDGVETVTGYASNIVAQTNNQISLFQDGLAGLTKAGVVTGKESGTQIAGLVSAAASVGTKEVTNFVKQLSASGNISNLAAPATALSGKIKDSISSGNFAANLADKISNPLGSILASVKKSVTSLVETAKGAAASAFAAIKSGLTKLKGGVPQNLTALNQKNAELQDAASVINSEIPKVSTTFSLADVKTLKDTVIKGAGVISGLSGLGLKLPVGEINALAGGLNAISKVVDNTGIGSSLASVGLKIKSGISSLTNSITSGNIVTKLSDTLKTGLAKGLSAATAALGLPASVLAKLNSSVQSLGSGGPQSLVMPVVAVNTIDTTAIKKQVTSLVGDSRVPLLQSNNIESSVSALTQNLPKILSELQAKAAAALAKYEAIQSEFSSGKNFSSGATEADRERREAEAWKEYVAIKAEIRAEEAKASTA
ncbi:MAG: hypothetical protein ACOVLB_04730 [Candidatus Nanopelagicus sp.]